MRLSCFFKKNVFKENVFKEKVKIRAMFGDSAMSPRRTCHCLSNGLLIKYSSFLAGHRIDRRFRKIKMVKILLVESNLPNALGSRKPSS